MSLLEAPLLGIDSVEQIISSSSEGNARIYLDFKPGTDMSRQRGSSNSFRFCSNLPEASELLLLKKYLGVIEFLMLYFGL